MLTPTPLPLLYISAPLPRAKLDTVSKAKYGTWIQELGGWTVLQVGGRRRPVVDLLAAATPLPAPPPQPFTV
jgi:hypothetical protein